MREAMGRGDERMKNKGCLPLKLVVVAFPHGVKQNQTRERQLGKWSLPSNYDKALILLTAMVCVPLICVMSWSRNEPQGTKIKAELLICAIKLQIAF